MYNYKTMPTDVFYVSKLTFGHQLKGVQDSSFESFFKKDVHQQQSGNSAS